MSGSSIANMSVTKSAADGIGAVPANDPAAAGASDPVAADIFATGEYMPTTIVGTMLIEEFVTLTTENDTTDMSEEVDDTGQHSPVITAFVSAALCLIIILTVGGNILVVLSPIVSKRLRTVTYTFLVSLAIADLLLGITVLPWSAIYTISSEWPFSVVFCNIYISCDVMFCTASILHLLVISLERYFAITRPYAYQRKMNHRKAWIVIVFVWVVSLGVSFLPLHLGWNTADGSVQNYKDPTQCILTWNMAYALFDGILLFFLPLILMLFVYARIVTIAYHQAKAIKSMMVTPAPSIRGTNSSQEKQENTNNNHKNVIDEHKAVKIIAVVMGSFVVCWVPYFTMFTFGPLCNWNISDLFYNIVLWLGYINSLINPLVYALMNREFRRAFKTILSCARWDHKCVGSFGSRDHDSQIKSPVTNQNSSRYNGSVVTYSTKETYASSINESRKSSETYSKLYKTEGGIPEVDEQSSEEKPHTLSPPQEQHKVSPAESLELRDINDSQKQEKMSSSQTTEFDDHQHEQQVSSEQQSLVLEDQQLQQQEHQQDTKERSLSLIAEVSEPEQLQEQTVSMPQNTHELGVEDQQQKQQEQEQLEESPSQNMELLQEQTEVSPSHSTELLQDQPTQEQQKVPSSENIDVINENQHLLQDDAEHDQTKTPLSHDKVLVDNHHAHEPQNNEIIS